MPQPLRGFAMTSFFINFRAMQQRPLLARMAPRAFLTIHATKPLVARNDDSGIHAGNASSQ
ncbi:MULTISPECIES: hypothetical protein [unclassified Rickettsia]|uniref:hypothetical protein n=1 Tax=unclassified Rickettsia TaxID=114295 RepID=UPI00313324F6